MSDTAKKGDSGPVVQFGRVPYAVIASGALCRLRRNELAVYVVIAAHVNRDWWATLTTERLADFGGMSQRTARRVTAQLAARGLLTVARGGGRGLANTYTLATNPDSIAVTVLGSRKRYAAIVTCGNPDKSPSKPGQLASETVSDGAPNPDTQGVRRTEEQIEQSNRRPPAGRAAAAADELQGRNDADSKADPGVIEALTAAGIGEPTRGQLATLPGITPQLVRDAAERVNAKGGGPGLAVNAIRAAVEAQTIQADQRCAEARAEQKRRAAEAAERQRLDGEWRETRAWYDELSPDQRAELKARAIATHPGWRHSWEHADPAENRFLMVAMRDLARKREKGLA